MRPTDNWALVHGDLGFSTIKCHERTGLGFAMEQPKRLCDVADPGSRRYSMCEPATWRPGTVSGALLDPEERPVHCG